MNLLDLRTVLFSYVISNAICTVVMLYLWKQSRGRAAGVGFWSAGFILNFFAILLIGLRGVVPDWISIVIGNVLVPAAFLLVCVGVERYAGITSRPYPNYILLILFIFVQVYFTYVEPNLVARKINISVIISFICFPCAWRLLGQADSEMRQVTKAIGAILVLYGLVSAVRIFIDLTSPSGNNFFASAVFDTAVIMTYQMLLIAMTLALFLAVNRRLFVQLERDITHRAHAEENLRQSELRYRNLIENARQAILVVQRGMIKYANPILSVITGYTQQEMYSRPFPEFIYPDDKSMVVERYRKRLAGASDNLPVYTFRVLAKDGSVCWFESNAVNIEWEGLPATLNFLTNLTERKQTEEAMQVSEEKYRLLAENVTDVIWTMNFEGRFTYVSPSVKKMLGYTVDEVMQQSLDEALMPESSAIAKARLAEAREAMHTGVPPDIFRGEFQQNCKGGRTVWMETTVSGLRNAAGEMIGILGVSRDISERKRSEDLIRARLELLEYAASHTVGEVLQRTLDQAGEMTASPIGFYHFVESDQKTLSLQAWSTRTLNEFCKADGYGMHYPIDQAGVWVDCVHLQKPVIHNDYASLSHRKGLPDGHAPVIRELVVPIMRAGEIVSILGVGNKATDYTEKDVALVQFFADVAWEVAKRKRTEAALIESEARYAVTLEAVNDGLWDWHVPSGRAFFSPLYYAMLGYEDGEFVASYVMWRGMIHPDDVDRVEKDLQKSVESGDGFNIELRLKMKSGRFRWVVTRGNAVERDADGKVLRMVGTLSDITDRKQAERYRGLSAEVLQILNESNDFRESIHSILIAVKDVTGHDAVGMRLEKGEDYPYCDQTGFDGDFLLTENSLVVRDHNGCLCRWSDGSVLLECACGLVISGRTDPASSLFTAGGSFWTNDSLPLLTLPGDEDLRHHPRNKCVHYGYASLAMIPIRARQKIIGLLQLNDRRKDQFSLAAISALENIASHIGEALVRKQTEAALQESESKYRLLVDHSSDLIWNLTTDGIFTYVSPSWERVTGYPLVSLLNTPFHPLVHPDDIAVCVEYLQSMIDGRINVTSAEYRVLHADGTWHWHAANATPVTGSDGKYVSMVGVSRDITEQKKGREDLWAEKEKAEEASRAKSEFLSIMSHEIRTPLNAIIGMSELLGETKLDDDQQNYVKTFRNAGESLLSIINNILDYSKIEAGKVEIESADFDLTDVIERISAILALQAHKKHVELIVDMPADVPSYLVGDQQHLRQVLMNLIGNAVKFTEKGQVMIRLEKGSENAADRMCEVKFMIEDTGVGIAADKMPIIFERFSQADSSVTRKFGGTGLGLAISQKLVELMGGHIFVESKPGQGSKFFFTLPFGLQKDEERKEREKEIDMKGLRVLVVDDNATNRLIVNRMLSPWGATVTDAFDAKDAMKELRRLIRFREAPYDLIIIDRHMPGMDGFELAEYIRDDPRLKASRMIMMTSDSFNIDMARVNKFGISGYLVKPVKKSDLKESIIRALQMEGTGEDLPAAVRPTLRLKPLKVLLVEDAENNRVLIRSYLKKTPFIVDEAENGQVAVDKFKTGSYDIVLMDVQMPVMDGYTATLEIRNWERQRSARPTPVLALTAHVFKDDIKQSLNAGCNAHLTKPIKKEALLEAILLYTAGGQDVSTEKIKEMLTVHVDPDLRDILPQFMENTRKDIDAIATALSQEDRETVRRISHSMKSYGIGYGFEFISKMGKAMEATAMNDQLQSIDELLTELKNYLDKVTVAYD
jgi:PAS domain S-box-containing protein